MYLWTNLFQRKMHQDDCGSTLACWASLIVVLKYECSTAKKMLQEVECDWFFICSNDSKTKVLLFREAFKLCDLRDACSRCTKPSNCLLLQHIQHLNVPTSLYSPSSTVSVAGKRNASSKRLHMSFMVLIPSESPNFPVMTRHCKTRWHRSLLFAYQSKYLAVCSGASVRNSVLSDRIPTACDWNDIPFVMLVTILAASAIWRRLLYKFGFWIDLIGTTS